jgi:hypothetical protein
MNDDRKIDVSHDTLIRRRREEKKKKKEQVAFSHGIRVEQSEEREENE